MTQYNKVCKICSKEFIGFNWRASVCSHECHLAYRRNWHIENGDKVRASARAGYHNGRKSYYAKYEKTMTGFLMRLYRNMQSRVTGVQKLKFHLYEGKSLLPRKEFYDWANKSEQFHLLYEIWTQSKYDRKLTPSVDRIDSSKGYELDNMRWITHSENSRLGSFNAHEVLRLKRLKKSA